MKKKSSAKSLADYRASADAIRAFLDEAVDKGLSAAALTHCYDHALLWTYRAFEGFVLDICIARINSDPTSFYEAVGVEFPRHITAAQCEFLLVGDRYFDFRGHSGLTDVIAKVSGRDSPMHTASRVAANRQAFNILASLRNYVAHESSQSRRAALGAMREWEPGRSNLGYAGTWLKAAPGGQTRMERLLAALDGLCQSLANAV